MSYAREVGDRLRRLRLDRGLSLQEVERTSGGRWKAAVIGSYERGDRNISATRLLELAAFYDVSPADLLAGRSSSQDAARGGLVFDLQAVERLGPPYRLLRRYIDSIRFQRGDFNRRVLSLRGDDLRTLAVIQETSAQQLLHDLRRCGAITGGRMAQSRH